MFTQLHATMHICALYPRLVLRRGSSNTCRHLGIFSPLKWPCSFYQLSLVRCCKVINWFWRRWRRRVKDIQPIEDLLMIVFNFCCGHVILYMLTENKRRINRSSSSTIPHFSVTLNCNPRRHSCRVVDNRRMD